MAAAGPSGHPNTAVPATRTLAPAAAANLAVSGFIPPSTCMFRVGNLLRSCLTLSRTCGWNFWPPKPHSTVIHRTYSTCTASTDRYTSWVLSRCISQSNLFGGFTALLALLPTHIHDVSRMRPAASADVCRNFLLRAAVGSSISIADDKIGQQAFVLGCMQTSADSLIRTMSTVPSSTSGSKASTLVPTATATPALMPLDLISAASVAADCVAAARPSLPAACRKGSIWNVMLLAPAACKAGTYLAGSYTQHTCVQITGKSPKSFCLKTNARKPYTQNHTAVQ
eukprot:GHUV01011978.1.p1 GENE.GHUV01011978.1~~GHUV01011978.1.p1  ORF type:complete len:283 (-),score=41.52 GHUV01011978.1:483-1331(-)